MMKKIKYEYVDNKGVKLKLDVEFLITPYREGDRFNPPENGEVEIYSITQNGIDFEVPDSEIIEIEEFIKSKADEYDPFKNLNF
jgi:hypothetical protein